MSNNSYKHQNIESEQQRLVLQFQREWPWEKEVLKKLGVVSDMPLNKNALSYGCGVGIDAATLFEEGYAEVVEGWDTSEAMINFAMDHFTNKKVIYKHCDLLDIELNSVKTKFDLIYCRLVLFHNKLSSLTEILKRCSDMLNNNGLLVVHDVNKTKDSISPANHEFNIIQQKINDYLLRCGNSPMTGCFVPEIFNQIGLHNVRSEEVEIIRTFDETKLDLDFSVNIKDESKKNGKLISKELWDIASNKKIDHFMRKTYRIFSVGQK